MNDELKQVLGYAESVAKKYYYKVIPGADHIIREGERAGELDPTYEGFKSAAHEIVLRCAQTYDPKKANGATLMTYCRKPLQSGMQKYIRSDVQEIRINKDAQRESKRCRALQRAMANLTGEDPEYKELAAVMGITEDRVGELLSLVNPFPYSLDYGKPVQGSSNVDENLDDEESTTPYSHETVACTRYPNPEDHLLLKEKIIKRRTNDRGQTLDKKYNKFDVYGENWYEANYGSFNDKRGRENGPSEYHEEGSHGGCAGIHRYKNLRNGFSYKLFKTGTPMERKAVFYHNGNVVQELIMGPSSQNVEETALEHVKRLAKLFTDWGRLDEDGKVTFKREGAKPLPSKEAVKKTLNKYIFKVLPEKKGIEFFECRDHTFALVPGDKYADKPSYGAHVPDSNPKILHLVIGELGHCPLQSSAFEQMIGTVDRPDLALLNSLEYLYDKTLATPIKREEA